MRLTAPAAADVARNLRRVDDSDVSDMIISPLRESALGIGEWSYLALMRSVSALMKI
jgi:hypothetical protein